MAETGLKCPVCKTPLPADGLECPTCGLPKELWPEAAPSGGSASGGQKKGAGIDDLFGDLMKDLEGLEEEPPPLAQAAAAAPPPPEPARAETTPAVAPPAPSAPAAPAPTPEPRKAESPRSERESAPSTGAPSPVPPSTPAADSGAAADRVPPLVRKSAAAETSRIPTPLPSTKERAEEARAEADKVRPKDLEPVQVASLADDTGMPLQTIMDEVSSLIQVGRRAAFDMTPFGPNAARAVGLVRAGASDEARRMLTALRKRLYDYLSPKFSARVEELEVKINRISTFLRTDQAKVHLDRTREALKAGDFPRAQLELRRLEGETTRLDDELGSLGQTLEQVDLLTREVERLGGDTTPALLYQGKALDAARSGDRKKAEGLLTTSSAILLDTMAPLMGQELVRLTQKIKDQRAKGRDIRAAVGLIRQITVDLKTRNYMRSVAALTRLREEIAKGEEAAAAEAAAAKEAESSKATTRSKARGTSTTTVTSVSADGKALPSSPSPPPAPAPAAPPAPAPTPVPEPVAPPKPLEVKAGRSYLIFEARPKRAGPIFLKLKGEKSGLFLTTTFPPKITDAIPLPGAEIVWLSDSTGWEDSINPRTLEHDLASRVHSFLKGEEAGALALDGLGYLISENGVDKVEKFLKSVLDTAATRSVGVVVTLAQGGLDMKVQSRLEALFDASA